MVQEKFPKMTLWHWIEFSLGMYFSVYKNKNVKCDITGKIQILF